MGQRVFAISDTWTFSWKLIDRSGSKSPAIFASSQIPKSLHRKKMLQVDVLQIPSCLRNYVKAPAYAELPLDDGLVSTVNIQFKENE